MTSHNIRVVRDPLLPVARAISKSRARHPEWTSDEIAIVRRCAARGLSSAAAKEVLNSPLSATALCARAKALGIRFYGRDRATNGFETTVSNVSHGSLIQKWRPK